MSNMSNQEAKFVVVDVLGEDGGGTGAGTAAATQDPQVRDATVPMVARKGRASYLGERSAGHADPGATSVALLVHAAADALA